MKSSIFSIVILFIILSLVGCTKENSEELTSGTLEINVQNIQSGDFLLCKINKSTPAVNNLLYINKADSAYTTQCLTLKSLEVTTMYLTVYLYRGNQTKLLFDNFPIAVYTNSINMITLDIAEPVTIFQFEKNNE